MPTRELGGLGTCWMCDRSLVSWTGRAHFKLEIYDFGLRQVA